MENAKGTLTFFIGSSPNSLCGLSKVSIIAPQNYVNNNNNNFAYREYPFYSEESLPWQTFSTKDMAIIFQTVLSLLYFTATP